MNAKKGVVFTFKILLKFYTVSLRVFSQDRSLYFSRGPEERKGKEAIFKYGGFHVASV